ncbi:hypothetical protein OIO90_004285 [Microbotryomycetes sp. JL221]|nr:hypothetical protein OIO90_004285 [Microbotryomycetes sp. JL221]
MASLQDASNVTSSSFVSLLEPTFPSLSSSSSFDRLVHMLDNLVQQRANQQLEHHVANLSGQLRDDYKSRASAVKADFMARLVHEQDDDDAESTSDDDNIDGIKRDNTRSRIPTIQGDPDSVNDMSRNVDSKVHDSIKHKQEEARQLLKKSAHKTATLQVEMLVMTPLLHWRADGIEDEQELLNMLIELLETETS